MQTRKNILSDRGRTRSSIIVFLACWTRPPLNTKLQYTLRPSKQNNATSSINQHQTHPAQKPQVIGAQDILRMGSVIAKNEKAQIRLRLEASKARRSTLMGVHGRCHSIPQLCDNARGTLKRRAKHKSQEKYTEDAPKTPDETQQL